MKNKVDIGLATSEDFDSWMELIDKVKWNFPGLDCDVEYENYRMAVRKFINRGTAICAQKNSTVVGVLLFSMKHKMLCCMAVDPDYRRLGIATGMIQFLLTFFDNSDEIILSTFREDDEKGVAPRALYKRLGFCESELCEEFNYPHQKFVLKPR